MDLSVFKDPELAKGLIHSIQKWAPQQATLMEVCGTHTVSIARNGLRTMMPEGTRLASGPGCPVCVTSNKDIDSPEIPVRDAGVNSCDTYCNLNFSYRSEMHPERSITP